MKGQNNIKRQLQLPQRRVTYSNDSFAVNKILDFQIRFLSISHAIGVQLNVSTNN